MNEPLDELYFTWLYGRVGSVKLRNRAKSFWSLSRQLFRKEFVWFVPNDDNRAADGKLLRLEFLTDEELEVDDEWVNMGCSMFELLIALSRRLAFETDSEPRAWFWHLIQVLDLQEYNDRVWDGDSETKVEEVLDRVIFRNYEADGSGGLFPLQRPQRDQRGVELWYQLSAYLLELP